jgi:hypothetical protein
MKLTRGKIEKLYNKKNQTMKRFKNKESRKSKTFRFYNVNLANKTLKNL